MVLAEAPIYRRYDRSVFPCLKIIFEKRFFPQHKRIALRIIQQLLQFQIGNCIPCIIGLHGNKVFCNI